MPVNSYASCLVCVYHTDRFTRKHRPPYSTTSRARGSGAMKEATRAGALAPLVCTWWPGGPRERGLKGGRGGRTKRTSRGTPGGGAAPGDSELRLRCRAQTHHFSSSALSGRDPQSRRGPRRGDGPAFPLSRARFSFPIPRAPSPRPPLHTDPSPIPHLRPS